MENFLIRHTIPMPDSKELIRRHYQSWHGSREAALKAAYKIDDGDKSSTLVEVIGRVVNGWPVYDL